MNIGIFAGTFDPIHNGHIAFALAATTQAKLDKVLIVAEKEPYRKKPLTSWDHRQAMVERATQEIENVDHNYAFAAELAHQHTMKNMLEVAEKHYGSENTYWFLVGSDLFEHMHQWHDLVTEQQYGGFIVALRENHTLEWVQEKQREMQKNGLSGTLQVIPNQHPQTSSNRIREAIKVGEVPAGIAPQILAYIKDHHLYAA